jgi:hypothetical protein
MVLIEERSSIKQKYYYFFGFIIGIKINKKKFIEKNYKNFIKNIAIIISVETIKTFANCCVRYAWNFLRMWEIGFHGNFWRIHVVRPASGPKLPLLLWSNNRPKQKKYKHKLNTLYLYLPPTTIWSTRSNGCDPQLHAGGNNWTADEEQYFFYKKIEKNMGDTLVWAFFGLFSQFRCGIK